MSRRDPNVAYDGISVINGGMDSGNMPVTIGRSKVSFARNVAFRRGHATTRPGIRRRPLLFSDATTQLRFEESLFQGASPYSPYAGGAKLVAQIGGRTFKIDVDEDYMVSDLSLAGDLNPSTRPKSWFVQAEDFLVIQDGQSAALIYDGVTLRRVIPSSVPNELPVGTVMEYSMGRLWVTLPNGRSFVAGDLAYSDSGTAAYNNRDAVLKFTENDFLNEGGEFGVPSDVGPITAMRAIAVLDTSLGQGPLQVMAERGIFSVDAPFDRTEWKNLERPIQTVSLMGNGARSHESSIGINGDLWFRSSDGIRSFQVARRDFGAWVNTPVSTEMAAIIDLDDRTLLLHSSAAIFDNRYLLTASPARVAGHGVIWRGLVALDFDNVSGLTARSAPAYDGFWTGVDILQIVPLDDRCFYFVLNSAGRIELWEQTRHDEFDNQGSSTPTRISCFIDTPAFDFTDKGWDRKVIATADTWWRDLAGYVDFNVEWRPDDHECWTQWHSWCVDSKRTTCLDECGFPLSLRPQYRPRMRLPLPPDDCNEKANMPLRHGFHHQLRIAWTGRARLTKLRLVAHEWEEETEPHCEPCDEEGSDTTGVPCCDTALFSYRSLYYSASASASCDGGAALSAEDDLPAWLSISGSSLVLAAGHFTASTQAAADALATTYVTDYLSAGLENGTLECAPQCGDEGWCETVWSVDTPATIYPPVSGFWSFGTPSAFIYADLSAVWDSCNMGVHGAGSSASFGPGPDVGLVWSGSVTIKPSTASLWDFTVANVMQINAAATMEPYPLSASLVVRINGVVVADWAPTVDGFGNTNWVSTAHDDINGETSTWHFELEACEELLIEWSFTGEAGCCPPNGNLQGRGRVVLSYVGP